MAAAAYWKGWIICNHAWPSDGADNDIFYGKCNDRIGICKLGHRNYGNGGGPSIHDCGAPGRGNGDTA